MLHLATCANRNGELGSLSRLALACTLILLVPTTSREGGFGPSVCLGESTGNSNFNEGCYPKWPSSDWKNACPLKWCQFRGNSSKMAVDSQVNCRDIDADRSWVAANILELSEPDCGPAPGPPTDLVAASALTPFEYRITVKWIDPAHAPGLIGYELQLFRVMKKYGNNKSQIKQFIRGRTPFTSFSVSKNFSSLRQRPGDNLVSIATSKAKDLSEGANTVQMTDVGMRTLFKDLAHYVMVMRIVSLPVRSGSSNELEKQSDTVNLNIEECDNEKNKCFKSIPFNKIDTSSGCLPDALQLPQIGYRDVCECYMYDVFNFVNIAHDNDSITFSWMWGIDAESLDAKVHVSVSTTNPIVLVWIAHSDIKVSDKMTSMTVNIADITPGMEITVTAQRIVVKDDIEEWKGSRSLSIIVAEETAVPHAPSTTVGYSTTVRTGSSSPPVTKSSPASSSVSTALIISVVTLLVILLLVVLVVALFTRLHTKDLTPGFLTLWASKIDRFRKVVCPVSTDPLLPYMDIATSKPRVYISYSRFSNTSKENARHLRTLLAQNEVEPVLDEDYRNEMADNEPRWVMEEIEAATCVIILLDEAYPWVLGSNAVLQLLSLDDGSSTSLAKQESDLLQNQVYWGKPGFIVPVFVGPESKLQSCLPSVLRCHTIHRLPVDFTNTSGSISQLVSRLKLSSGTQQV